MKSYILVVTSLLLLISGCDSIKMPGAKPSQTSQEQSQKFNAPKDQAPTPVESAIMMSDKYAKLSEEMSAEKAKNALLTDQNAKLQDQAASLKQQLEQAQKELNEANALLIDMRKELNTWKADVLGYRDEMRTAHKAQLEALLRIISLLGGESPAPAPIAEPNIPAAPKPAEPNK
jgi:septal ring factor EnvC (AmiA/AmiB activator)